MLAIAVRENITQAVTMAENRVGTLRRAFLASGAPAGPGQQKQLF